MKRHITAVLTALCMLTAPAVPLMPERMQMFTAHAEESGTLTTPYSIGDVTGDCTINANDANAVLIAAAKLGTGSISGLTYEAKKAADVNADGTINANDANIILRFAAAVGTGAKVKIEDYQETTEPEPYISPMLELEEPQTVSNEEDALALLDTQIAAIGLSGKAEEHFRLSMIDENSTRRFYQMQQQYQGIDVYGASVLLSVNQENSCDCMVNYTTLDVSGDTNADLSEKQALQAVRDLDAYGSVEQTVSLGQIMYPDASGTYRLCYEFYVDAIAPDEKHCYHDTVFLDADTGEILAQNTCVLGDTAERTSQTLTDSAGNPLHYHLLETEQDYLIDEYTGIHMYNAKNNLVDVRYLDSAGEPISAEHIEYEDIYGFRFIGTSSLWRPESWFASMDDANSADSGYDRLLEIYEQFEKVYDFYESKGMSGFCTPAKAGMHDPHVIAVITNSGDLYSNANSMSHIPRGLNSTVIKISPEYVESCNEDVIYHEYTHSVIGCKDKLITYVNENGALNEAYADIMGDVIANDHSWTHGKRDAKSERSRNDSEWISTSLKPTELNDYNGVHKNCEVIYHCAYLMYQQLTDRFGMSEDAAMAEVGNLWFDSMSYLPQDNATFEDCLEALYRAGKDRKYDIKRLQMIEDCFCDINVKRTSEFSLQDAVRTYSGTYTFATGQGLTGLDFTIFSLQEDGQAEALFSFHAHPSNSGVPSGSYRMAGTVQNVSDSGCMTIGFKGKEWIVQPSGFHMLNFTAAIDLRSGTLTSKDYEINLTTSRVVPYTDLTGTYEGTYVAGQGLTAMRLKIITCSENGLLSATTEFYEHPDNPGVPSGSTHHSGKIAGVSQDGTVRVLLEGAEWIEQPLHYKLLNFLTVISPDRKTIVSDDYALDLEKTG